MWCRVFSGLIRTPIFSARSSSSLNGSAFNASIQSSEGTWGGSARAGPPGAEVSGLLISSITLAKPRGKQAGLIIERSGRGVVPNDVIGARDLGREVELRLYHPLNQLIRKPSLQPQPFALGHWRAGDHDHSIDVRLPARLVEERNVRIKTGTRAPGGIRIRDPLCAHERMQDRFRLEPGGIILKDQVAQRRPIKRLGRPENRGTERVAQRGLHRRIVGEELMHATIRVEMFRGRMLQQRTNEG